MNNALERAMRLLANGGYDRWETDAQRDLERRTGEEIRRRIDRELERQPVTQTGMGAPGRGLLIDELLTEPPAEDSET